MSSSSSGSSVEVRRLSSGLPATRSSGAVVEGAARPAVADSLTYDEWDELVDEVVERIERRVLDELDRRGRRFVPGAF